MRDMEFIKNGAPLDGKRQLREAFWADRYGRAYHQAYNKARNLMSARARIEHFHCGFQSVIYTFDNGLAIKLSRIDFDDDALTWFPEYGHRPFDLPIIAEGTVETDNGDIHWAIVPKILYICEDGWRDYLIEIRKYIQECSYNTTWDFRAEQCGVWHGRVYLIDYNCAA